VYKRLKSAKRSPTIHMCSSRAEYPTDRVVEVIKLANRLNLLCNIEIGIAWAASRGRGGNFHLENMLPLVQRKCPFRKLAV